MVSTKEGSTRYDATLPERFTGFLVNLTLNHRGGISLRQQIVWQIEMKILSGELAKGQKLPSVRSLARRLDVHPRTVYNAYKQLELNDNLELHPGSGAFVRRGASGGRASIKDLDLSLRDALTEALRVGLSPAQIREAVSDWLATPPPQRVVVVDVSRETAELIVAELAGSLGGVPCIAATFGEITADGSLLGNALGVALPFHAGRLERLVPGAPVVQVDLEVSSANAALVKALPQGAIVLVVSHSPRVLPYAREFLEGLRGDDLVVQCHRLSLAKEWFRTAPTANLVFADIRSVATLADYRRKLQVFRLTGPKAVSTIRAGLALPPFRIPKAWPGVRAPRRSGSE